MANLLNIKDAVQQEWSVSPCYVQMQWVIRTCTGTDGRQLYLHSPSLSELTRWVEMRNAEKIAAETRQNTDLELREEIVEELMANGYARHVAMNLTNTEAKMLEQGRLVGVV
jgi:hypothetical protein